LVELLVVIAIIGILVALLLPAVQAARESARMLKCKNNLKQVGLAWLNHHDTHKHFPTGGWGAWWTGDPDRGYGKKQPGGWCYNILPFLEEQALHDLGAGLSASAKQVALVEAMKSYVPVFVCPSRRETSLSLQIYMVSGRPANATITSMFNVGRSDYAANCGSQEANQLGVGPSTLAAGDSPVYAWPDTRDHTGVSYLRSDVKLKHITDGSSHTYMVGEKYLRTDWYNTGQDDADNEWLWVGYDNDIYRSSTSLPLKDGYGVTYLNRYGSAHAAAWHVVLCDGTVHGLSYDIDAKLHQNFGNRKDGEPTSVP
jgi:hypothetical protein